MIGVLLAALLAAGDSGASYEETLARGIAAGRDGRLEEAAASLDAAVRMDPLRSEAYVELGGLFFLEGRYEAAAAKLRLALARKEDPYARDLLGTALALADRGDEALDVWNALGKPRVSRVEISGLVHTLDKVARREVPVTDGELLTSRAVREARLRLRELEAFDRWNVSVASEEGGMAQLNVALLERHGFGSPLSIAASAIPNAVNGYAEIRYADLGGEGITLGGLYRWEENRPCGSITLLWPRPLGLDANLRFQASDGRQLYDVGEPIDSRYHGFVASLRRVLGASTVAEVSLGTTDRTFSAVDPQAPPGRILVAGASVEHRLFDRRRQSLDGKVRFLGGAFAAAYQTALLGATYRLSLSAPDGSAIEPSVLAARVQGGYASPGTPLDELFAPGGSPDMELPLRAHPQAQDGTLGRTPLARTLLLSNLEWRRRLGDTGIGQLGLVAFWDGAALGGERGSDLDHTLEDVGIGVRLALRGGPVLRLDYGHGLTDGHNALFVGLGQVF